MSVKPITELNIVSKRPALTKDDADRNTGMSVPMLFPLPSSQAEGFLNIVQRLEDIIDLETKTLQSFHPVALREFNHKKIYGLLELLRVVPTQGSNAQSPELELVLGRLRRKLEKNLAVLHMHLTAIREISAVMTNAIKEYDSDGTYTGQMSGFGALR